METQPGFTLWLTGMSRAGKSELARHLVGRLRSLGRRVELLDENHVESLVEEGPDAVREIRERNVRQLGWAARLLTRNGVVAVVASLSPHRDIRDEVRRQIGRYVEVFVDCPFDVLQQRDGSGVYRKALKGELHNVTGVQAPYETSPHFDVTVDTSRATVEEMAGRVFERLFAEGYVRKEEITALRSQGADEVEAYGDVGMVSDVDASAETEAPPERPVLRLVPAPEPTLPEGELQEPQREEGAAAATDGAGATPEIRSSGGRKSRPVVAGGTASDAGKRGAGKAGAGKAGVGKAGSAKAGSAKAGSAKAGSAKESAVKAGTAKINAAKADVAGHGAASSDVSQNGATKKAGRSRSTKHGAAETEAAKTDLEKTGAAKTGPTRADPAKKGPGKVHPAKAGAAKNTAGGTAARKAPPGKGGTTKARTTDAGAPTAAAEKDAAKRTGAAKTGATRTGATRTGAAKSRSATSAKGTNPKAGAETPETTEVGDVARPEVPTKTVAPRNAARVARPSPSKKRQGA